MRPMLIITLAACVLWSGTGRAAFKPTQELIAVYKDRNGKNWAKAGDLHKRALKVKNTLAQEPLGDAPFAHAYASAAVDRAFQLRNMSLRGLRHAEDAGYARFFKAKHLDRARGELVLVDAQMSALEAEVKKAERAPAYLRTLAAMTRRRMNKFMAKDIGTTTRAAVAGLRRAIDLIDGPLEKLTDAQLDQVRETLLRADENFANLEALFGRGK